MGVAAGCGRDRTHGDGAAIVEPQPGIAIRTGRQFRALHDVTIAQRLRGEGAPARAHSGRRQVCALRSAERHQFRVPVKGLDAQSACVVLE